MFAYACKHAGAGFVPDIDAPGAWSVPGIAVDRVVYGIVLIPGRSSTGDHRANEVRHPALMVQVARIGVHDTASWTY